MGPLFFRAYQVNPIENGIFSVSPHVIFSSYEIIQKNGGFLKSQTDVIILKCRSKVSLESYAEKELILKLCNKLATLGTLPAHVNNTTWQIMLVQKFECNNHLAIKDMKCFKYILI